MILKDERQPNDTLMSDICIINTAFIYQFVIQWQGPLNVCCSVNNQFQIKKIDKRKQLTNKPILDTEDVASH
jgi:hypothetical protein